MRGPIAFWTVLLGSVAVLFIGLWLASPHAEEPSSTEIEAEVSTEDPVQLSTSQEAMSDSQVEAADPGDTWWSDEAEPTSEPGWSFGSGADRSSLPETIGQGALTVQQAAYRVNQSGPALVIIFSTDCPLSQTAFPKFSRIADSLAPGVEVLAFSTDSDQGIIDSFVARSGASFGVERLAPWRPGEMGSAMGSVGIRVGSTWVKPLMAVIGRDGRVLGQWQGLTDLRPLESLVRSAGL